MANHAIIREPSHAGSWYTDDGHRLASQLDGWLNAVPSPVTCIGPRSNGHQEHSLPVASARVIIAPHAGYSYSGPAAAWAYRSWDISKAKRIFLLGPSHHYALNGAALSKCTHYRTPLGDLQVDRSITEELYRTGSFEYMLQSVDEEEHSLEMHLPYIYAMVTRTFGNDSSNHPLLVPIMIGNTRDVTEVSLGRILANYLADPETAFVISSDFAHWGSRFRYTYYRPPQGSAVDLVTNSQVATDWPIHESIKAVDFDCIGACESGDHNEWLLCLRGNGNTVCGRHPIGVIMAAIEEVRKRPGQVDIGSFRFVRYERSSEVQRLKDSSVSYASAFAIC